MLNQRKTVFIRRHPSTLAMSQVFNSYFQMTIIDFAKLLLKERERVNTLPDGRSYQISIVATTLAKQLDTTDYYVDKWIKHFVNEGFITFIRANRTKNIYRNGRWNNVYKYYDICVDKLNEFISEGTGYVGELRQFAKYLKCKCNCFNSACKLEVKTILKWDEKKYQRRLKQLISDGVIKNLSKRQCPDKSYVYSYEYVGMKQIESADSNHTIATTQQTTDSIKSESTYSIDQSIDIVIRLIKATGGDFSNSIFDENTKENFDYVTTKLKDAPMYRFDELTKLSTTVRPTEPFPFNTSLTLVKFWNFLYLNKSQTMPQKKEDRIFQLKNFWKNFF